MEVDKNKLIKLCDQIKAKLQEQGKTYYVLNIAADNKDFADVYDDMIDELMNKWYDNDLDHDTMIIEYDCGGYDRILQLYGIKIENDKLMFYITELKQSIDGDEEVGQWKLTLDELLDTHNWWMAGGNAVVPFSLDEVLEFYLDELL